MKKSVVALMLVLIFAASVMAWYGFKHFDEYMISPLERDRSLSDASKLTTDYSGNVYVIVQGKDSVIKLDVNKEQIFRIRIAGAGETSLSTFDEIAVDRDGYIYVLRTLLDRFGLHVVGEEIIRYTPEGTHDGVLHSVTYAATEELYRIGKIKGLQVKENFVYYFVNEGSKVSMHRIDLKGAAADELVMQADIPDNKHVSEIYGTDPGQVVYTTKGGEIHRIDISGVSMKIYPLGTEGRTGKTVPLSPKTDSFNYVYFINDHLNEVNRIDMMFPDEPEVFATGEGTAFAHLDVTFNGQVAVTQSNGLLRYSSSGQLLYTMENYELSADLYYFRWALWAMAVAFVITLAWMMRIFYVDILHRKVSLIMKQIAVVVPLLVFSIAFITNTVFTNVQADLEKEVYRELIMLANNGQQMLDGDRLAQMTSAADYMSDDYQAVEQSRKELFDMTMDFDREGLYSTIYRVEKGEIFKLFDDDDSIHMFESIDMDSDFEQVLQGHGIANEMKDENGYWIYAMAPIHDSGGQLVGVFETGKDMYAYQLSQRELYYTIAQQIVLLALGCVLVFVIATYWLLAPIRRLRSGVTEMAKGKWDVTVSIKSGDEVADVGARFNDMAGKIRRYIQDITATNEVTFRFVPQAFLKLLGKDSILDLQLGDQTERDMCIMVTNIKNFYDISKTLTPQENFNFLNSYLKRFGPVIRQHEGMISKYLGAGIMALFQRRTDEAMTAAIEMRKTLEEYNKHRDHSDYAPIDIGIALHKGPLMLGMIGEEKRMEGSVISDEVNLATHLETLCSTLGASILVTDAMMDSLIFPERYAYRALGMISLPGKDRPIQLFDVYHGDAEHVRKLKAETKLLFEKGVTLYQQGRFFDAREAFVEVIRINRYDEAAKQYFHLCDAYYQQGTDDRWNGSLMVS